MPVAYQYYPDQVLVLTFEDPVTFTEWRAAMDAALKDPGYSSRMRILSDRRGAEGLDSAFIREIINTYEERREVLSKHPVAILVATQESTAFGLGRMQEMLSFRIGVNVRTFTEYSAAMNWLKAQPVGDQVNPRVSC